MVTPDPLALNSSAIFVMEDAMELLLIILVLFLLFGGGGYYGYRRWR
jgi:ABC-type microcin C transport system permease subunit YejB